MILNPASVAIPDSFLNHLEDYKKRWHHQAPSWLFYGIGNVGRTDDGLGIRLVESIETLQLQNSKVFKPFNLTTPSNKINLLNSLNLNSNYQINIEDALEISKYEVVIFADATKENLSTPFQMIELKPSLEIQFSTHSLNFESLLSLCTELYQTAPHAFLLKMQGYEWNIHDQLSPQGELTLQKTLQETLRWFQSIDFNAQS
jgi:hydrogenase maturation protease